MPRLDNMLCLDSMLCLVSILRSAELSIPAASPAHAEFRDSHTGRALFAMSHGLKIAISGKGGVGKTTLSALLCELFAREGKVLAIDADPDANLGMALGFDSDSLQTLTAISEDKQLIKDIRD